MMEIKMNFCPDELKENIEFWENFDYKKGYWKATRKLRVAIDALHHLTNMDSLYAHEALNKIGDLE